MSQIMLRGVTFAYDGTYDNIFEDLNLNIDTDWRLGFIGRNGRGKTTFLKLLTGELYCSEIVHAPGLRFDYFPFEITNPQRASIDLVRELIAPYDAMHERLKALAEAGDEHSMELYGELLEEFIALDGYIIDELIESEAGKLQIDKEALTRPFSSLSGGEQVKLQLCALFLKKNNFLLIDEPTNHLDSKGRKTIAKYLASKSGFILVSHDRRFLDESVDHILSFNRSKIALQKGNYSSWEENKRRQDEFEIEANNRLKKEIASLSEAARRAGEWAADTERSKKGAADKGYVGHMAAKMMKRSKSIEGRKLNASQEKQTLLRNIETSDPLKIHPLIHPQNILISCRNFCVNIDGQPLFSPLCFQITAGRQYVVRGVNGSGKSTLLKALSGNHSDCSGELIVASGLIISHVFQHNDHLSGSLSSLCRRCGIDESLFKSILRKMDFSRLQFEKNIEDFSEGQKKKVMLAVSLCEKAHIYIWDEPLNFVDLPSRLQLEALICASKPTMIFVEHDALFCERIKAEEIFIERRL